MLNSVRYNLTDDRLDEGVEKHWYDDNRMALVSLRLVRRTGTPGVGVRPRENLASEDIKNSSDY